MKHLMHCLFRSVAIWSILTSMACPYPNQPESCEPGMVWVTDVGCISICQSDADCDPSNTCEEQLCRPVILENAANETSEQLVSIERIQIMGALEDRDEPPRSERLALVLTGMEYIDRLVLHSEETDIDSFVDVRILSYQDADGSEALEVAVPAAAISGDYVLSVLDSTGTLLASKIIDRKDLLLAPAR